APVLDRSHGLNNSATPRSGSPERNLVTLVLTPEMTTRSGDDSKALELKPYARYIELQIHFKSKMAYEKFGVLITAAGGTKVWEKYGLSKQSNSDRLTVTVPVDLFSTNDYILTLKASVADDQYQDIYDYLFRIRR